jgi:hypothetical protein
MAVEHQKGKITKWQHTFSFSEIEKQYIEQHQKKTGLTFNGAIRDIIRHFGEKESYLIEKS